VIALHQHFVFDDRHESGFLTEVGVARQKMGVGVDASGARTAFAETDHRRPFGEPRLRLEILLETVAQSVEPVGDLLARMSREIPGVSIDLDAGHDARLAEDFHEGDAVRSALPDGLVIENHAADAFPQTSRRDDHSR
jgi:hypothetical protein